MDESEGSTDSVLKHKPLWATYNSRSKDKKKNKPKKKGICTQLMELELFLCEYSNLSSIYKFVILPVLSDKIF